MFIMVSNVDGAGSNSNSNSNRTSNSTIVRTRRQDDQAKMRTKRVSEDLQTMVPRLFAFGPGRFFDSQ